jgi:mannose-1-phosphate guanylyltransferase
MEHTYVVIMAGGGGTRLWPLSRKSRPKQMLKLFGEKTLYQMAVDRLLSMMPAEMIFVVTVEEQAEGLSAQAPQIPIDHFILEPMPRGTASVVGIAATLLYEQDPDSVMIVVTADHYIGNLEQFHSVLRSACEVAMGGNLVTLGILPTYASVGYGYIHQGRKIAEVENNPVYEVRAFVEKPSQEIAVRYFESGEYAWNSGMFIWQTKRILDEIARQMPKLSDGIAEIRSRVGQPSYSEIFKNVWYELDSETIDYGVMENASDVCVIPAGKMEWFDIGNWDRFFDLMEPDEKGNLVLCKECIHVDTEGSLIFQQYDDSSEKLIAVLGMDELIIVDTDDITLICPRDKAEEVKTLVKTLSKMGKTEFL